MKKLFIAAALLMLALPVGAQNLWESLVVWLKSRSVVDSSYIYQRPASPLTATSTCRAIPPP